jgi:hypothetical protein
MAEKRKKRKRKSKGSGDEPTVGARAQVEDEGGGGLLQSIRSGFRQAAGVEESKPSRASNIFWTVLLIAAAALLLYRWYG